MRLANHRHDDGLRAALVVDERLIDASAVASAAGWSSADVDRATSTRWLVGLTRMQLAELQGTAVASYDALVDQGAVHAIDPSRLGPPIDRPEKQEKQETRTLMRVRVLPMSRDITLERTTGFEPATLTLAR